MEFISTVAQKQLLILYLGGKRCHLCQTAVNVELCKATLIDVYGGNIFI